MDRLRVPCLLLLAAQLPAVALGAQDSERPSNAAPLLLTKGHVLSPDGKSWLDDRAVLVEGGRIRAIGPATAIQAPAGTRVLDLGGAFLIPGLVDLHTHLLLHPYDETSWDDQVLRESLELRTLRAAAAARATLEAGFTTIRDLGTEGAGYADVALRDAFREGILPGPRILATTRAIVATGCYGPQGFDPRWDVPRGAQEATGVAEVRRVVREQVAAGADWIKVYADYRRRPGEPATPTFSLEELRALVEEASSAGLPVAAHASTAEGIRRAVLAGARTIEHGSGAGEASLRLMAERGVILCPTLAASEAMARYGGWQPGQPEPAGLRASRLLVRRALEAGVTLACGSDAGVFRHGDNAREIELMAAWGLGPGGALRAATATAAAVLGREEDSGRIAPGFVADVVAVGEDPLASATALREVRLVVLGGHLKLAQLGGGP